MIKQETIGKKLTKLRIKRGLTQGDLALKLGVSESCVSRYESGSRNPNDKMKTKIAKFYGTTVESIFYTR